MVSLVFLVLLGTYTNAAEKVGIGLLLPLTGPAATTGELIKLGNQLAVDEINESGGIKSLGGAKLELIVADHQAKPEVGIAQAERLIRQEKTPILIGGYMSSVIFTSSAVAEKNKIPYVVEGGTANSINERGFKYVFRVIPNSTAYGTELLKFLSDMGKDTKQELKKLGLIYETTLYGKEMAEQVKNGAPPLGLTIAADISYPPQLTDFTMTIAKLKAAKPDAVLVVPYVTDAINIIKSMRENQFNCQGIVGVGGFTEPAFTESLGKLSNYLFALSYMSGHMKLPGALKFSEGMKKKFNKPPISESAYAFTSIYIIREALEKAGSLDSTKIRDALASLDIAEFPWAVCSVVGAKFNEKGENVRSGLCVNQFLNEDYRTVWRPNVAAVRPVWPVPRWEDRK
jgi:branched-chain amino acid transport system substrate-binding protein